MKAVLLGICGYYDWIADKHVDVSWLEDNTMSRIQVLWRDDEVRRSVRELDRKTS